MKKLVEITNEMRAIKKKRLQDMEERIDKRIQRAVDKNQNSCYFCCDKDIDADIYDEIRIKYERAGYKIKPTGNVAGVWQRTEDIYW